MKKLFLVLALTVIALSSAARGLELPFDLNFNLGFDISVVPDAKDMSRSLGLVVTPEQVLSDKVRSLTITGTITNYNAVPCDGIEMTFAVTSYIGIGKSFARASVEPASLPPGGTAVFRAFISLDSENPRHAMYTVTARTP